MHVLTLASLVLSAAAGASAMTLVRRDTFAARNDMLTAKSSSDDFTGGHATFYSQNGLPGDCGVFHPDSSFIAALRTSISFASGVTSQQIATADHCDYLILILAESARYGPSSQASPNCGRSITLTNTNNAKSVTVTVADLCVTCSNMNDLDLSIGAFLQIATLADGDVPIVWHYND